MQKFVYTPINKLMQNEIKKLILLMKIDIEIRQRFMQILYFV